MIEVAIIGGGPAGFASARALAAEKQDWHITIYERQSIAGGVWNLIEDGPMYQDLETNVPKEFMAFKDYPLADDLPKYVKRQEIAAYFKVFGHIVAQSEQVDIEFRANVVNITKEKQNWIIELANAGVRKADFVLVASGHYEHPAYPHIKGLQEFQLTHPSRVKHSVHYIEPSPYTDHTVLVIGNASSGTDLTIQLLRVTDAVTVSRRTPSKADGLFEGADDVVLKPEAVEIDPDSGEVEFSDGTHGIYDDVIIATGYQWRYPFLSTYNSQQKRPFLTPPDYHRLQNLHQYIFYIDDPTMAFVMVNRMIIPIPWVESQAAVIARAWSGRLKLPSTEEMIAIDEQLIAEKGTGEGYLTLKYPEDLKFMNIYANSVESLEPSDGFYAEKWDPEKLERREKSMLDKLVDFQRKVADSRAKRQARTILTDLEQYPEISAVTTANPGSTEHQQEYEHKHAQPTASDQIVVT